MNIWGTRVQISGVRGCEYPGYEGINIRINIRVRGYKYPGYEGINIRGTRVQISGVRGYKYPYKYPGMRV